LHSSFERSKEESRKIFGKRKLARRIVLIHIMELTETSQPLWRLLAICSQSTSTGVCSSLKHMRLPRRFSQPDSIYFFG